MKLLRSLVVCSAKMPPECGTRMAAVLCCCTRRWALIAVSDGLYLSSSGTISILTLDRKSTRLNSSHLVISYAVFCLKKKKKERDTIQLRRLCYVTPPHPHLT